MTDLHNANDLEDLYGPLYRFSDHKRGEHITFRDEGQTITGTILWVVGPGPVYEGGKSIPAHYVVEADINASFPLTVFPGDIVMEGQKAVEAVRTMSLRAALRESNLHKARGEHDRVTTFVEQSGTGYVVKYANKQEQFVTYEGLAVFLGEDVAREGWQPVTDDGWGDPHPF